MGSAVRKEQPPGAEFDEDDDVQRLQQHRIDREHIDRDDRRGMRADELSPGGTASAGCG